MLLLYLSRSDAARERDHFQASLTVLDSRIKVIECMNINTEKTTVKSDITTDIRKSTSSSNDTEVIKNSSKQLHLPTNSVEASHTNEDFGSIHKQSMDTSSDFGSSSNTGSGSINQRDVIDKTNSTITQPSQNASSSISAPVLLDGQTLKTNAHSEVLAKSGCGNYSELISRLSKRNQEALDFLKNKEWECNGTSITEGDSGDLLSV